MTSGSRTPRRSRRSGGTGDPGPVLRSVPPGVPRKSLDPDPNVSATTGDTRARNTTKCNFTRARRFASPDTSATHRPLPGDPGPVYVHPLSSRPSPRFALYIQVPRCREHDSGRNHGLAVRVRRCPQREYFRSASSRNGGPGKVNPRSCEKAIHRKAFALSFGRTDPRRSRIVNYPCDTVHL